MQTNEQKIISRADGYITIDIPPVQFPTPVTAARWLVTSPVMRALLLVVIGVGIGHFWHSPPASTKISPVITITETLEDFVARESLVLTSDERKKLMAVTQGILAEHFDTPSAIREEFRFQRLKAGLDSPAFRNFSAKWAAKIEETATDSVETMRSIYESLLRGLEKTADGRPQTAETGVERNEMTVNKTIQRQRILRRR
jgi:hypothetical protein